MRELRIVAVDHGAHTMELRDDAGAVLGADVGAAGYVRLRDRAAKALGRRDERDGLRWGWPDRPSGRRCCHTHAGDVIATVRIRAPIPAPAAGQKPTHCRCGQTNTTLRYCRSCQQYCCRDCMAATYRCNRCQRKKEDDMGMKPRPRRTSHNGHKVHKSLEGGCGEIWPAGCTSWDGVTCSNCLQNHPDRVEVPECVEQGAQILIHNALVTCADKGYRITRGSCTNCDSPRHNRGRPSICCVCAPLVFRQTKTNGTDIETAAAKLLGVPMEWLHQFIEGFDDDGKAGMYPTAFRLGRSLRRKHNPEARS